MRRNFFEKTDGAMRRKRRPRQKETTPTERDEPPYGMPSCRQTSSYALRPSTPAEAPTSRRERTREGERERERERQSQRDGGGELIRWVGKVLNCADAGRNDFGWAPIGSGFSGSIDFMGLQLLLQS